MSLTLSSALSRDLFVLQPHLKENRPQQAKFDYFVSPLKTEFGEQREEAREEVSERVAQTSTVQEQRPVQVEEKQTKPIQEEKTSRY